MCAWQVLYRVCFVCTAWYLSLILVLSLASWNFACSSTLLHLWTNMKADGMKVVTDGHFTSGLLIELDLEDLGHGVIHLSKMWEPKCLQVLRRNYTAWVASAMAVWKFWLERTGCSIRWREMYCSLPLDIVSFFLDLCIESHSQNAGGGFGKKIVQDIGGTEPWVGSVLNEIWLWVGRLLLATTNLTAIILQINALSTVLCTVQVTWILNPPSLPLHLQTLSLLGGFVTVFFRYAQQISVGVLGQNATLALQFGTEAMDGDKVGSLCNTSSRWHKWTIIDCRAYLANVAACHWMRAPRLYHICESLQPNLPPF